MNKTNPTNNEPGPKSALPLIIAGETFQIALDPASPGKEALEWRNLQRGTLSRVRVESEFEVVVDRSAARVGITGWKGVKSTSSGVPDDEEDGFAAGYHRCDFDDQSWPGLMTTVAEGAWRPESIFWARTQVILPSDVDGQDITLILGGCGIFDFDSMRIFVNGHLIGQREEAGRWRQPGRFRFQVGSAGYDFWKFGEENLIAVQQGGYRARSRELDAVDPGGYRTFPMKCQWPVPWEQEIVFGCPDERLVFTLQEVERKECGAVRVTLISPEVEALLEFRKNHGALEKSLIFKCRGSDPLTILEVGLGEYETSDEVSDGEQGFPVFAGEDWFFGIQHPSGFVLGSGQRVSLRQVPGMTLMPGESWSSMTAVIGPGDQGGARSGFLGYLRPRMRRIRRGHDRPFAIIEPFGGKAQGTAEELERFWQFGYFDEDEAFLLSHLEKVAAMQEQTGTQFDAYFVDFWNAYEGGIDAPDPARFPNGFGPVFDRIQSLGMKPGLWMDSSWELWSCGGNPAVSGGLTHDPKYGSDRPSLCRATEPYRTMFNDAFVRYVRDHGVRFLKFDNLQACCFNPTHAHRPGRAATEAIQSAVIDTLQTVDAACPEVFFMLYWGHRSPWWLLHADTLFEPGLWIEAAHPGGKPTLFARDSVILGLDQAHRFCRDIPSPGKDSLGVWMSEWKWNTCLGTERWAEAMVMDLGRGSLLLQPWSDPDFLKPEDRDVLARFWHLLRTSPECFAKPRWILGDPWKNEPYGYLCTDGERSFVGVHNASWDYLRLTPRELGLPEKSSAEYVCWFPQPVRRGCPSGDVLIELAPFEVVLFEVADREMLSDASRDLPEAPWPQPSSRICRAASVKVNESARKRATTFPRPPAAVPPIPGDARYEEQEFELNVPAGDGTLFLSIELTRAGLPLPLEDAGSHFELGGEGVVPVLPRHAFSTPWQAWRIDAASSRAGFHGILQAVLPENTKCLLTARRL